MDLWEVRKQRHGCGWEIRKQGMDVDGRSESMGWM